MHIANTMQQPAFSTRGIKRRSHMRWTIAADVLVWWTSATARFHCARGTVRDMSCHGVLVEVDFCPPPNAYVQMNLNLSLRGAEDTAWRLTAKGVVLRGEGTPFGDSCTSPAALLHE